MTFEKVLREPLLHFFAIGALLFLAYDWLNSDPGLAADEIVIDQAQIASVTDAFRKTWRRPPTEEEMQGLLESQVREEILYREGVAIGFDQGDPIIRRRVAQKMSFVADGLVPDTPTDEELQTWLDERPDVYRVPARITFRQVYVNPERHGENLDSYLTEVSATLNDPGDDEWQGDSSMLPETLSTASPHDIERLFGGEFAASIAALDGDGWQGPVRSGYGLHFVKVLEQIAGRTPALDEVRDAVQRDLLNKRTEEIGEAFYQALRERYTVRIESAPRGS